MKDTILNTMVITAAFSAIVASSVGNSGSAQTTAVAQAPRVVEVTKTVVTAKRLPADAMLVAQSPRVLEMAKTVVTAKRLSGEVMLLASAQ